MQPVQHVRYGAGLLLQVELTCPAHAAQVADAIAKVAHRNAADDTYGSPYTVEALRQVRVLVSPSFCLPMSPTRTRNVIHSVH